VSKRPIFPQLERLSRYGRPRGYADDPEMLPVDRAIELPALPRKPKEEIDQ